MIAVNSHLPPLDAWVIVLNLIGVSVAVVVNWRAALRGLFRLRTVHAAVATLALLYVAGYVWLLVSEVEVASWSSVLRGLSLLAWVVVWILPACMSMRVSRELHQAIMDRQEEGRS